MRFLVFGLIILTLGCSKEESDFRLSEFASPILTGFEIRDERADIIEYYGTPNIKLAISDAEYSFVSFPNPTKNFCEIHIHSNGSKIVKKLWIVKANYQGDSPTASTSFCSNNLVVGGAPIFQSEFTSDNISINLSNIDEGFYRVYLKIDEFLLYDNIIVLRN